MRAPADKIVIIVGPTAIGKTTLAIRLAGAINGEIISADSMQVYKGMRILSQAPTAAEKKAVRHHLVEILTPAKEYSVAAFIKAASREIESIIKRGKIPVIVGGSGLYVKGLVDGLFPSPKGDMKFRKTMMKFAAGYGSRKLHARLAKIDPESAKKIHPNDLHRIIRALELYNSTGKTMTELKALTRGLKDGYKIEMFGLIRPREEIYSRINDRIDRMFRGRVVAEVKRLARKKVSKTARAALGYREMLEYFRQYKGKEGKIREEGKVKGETRGEEKIRREKGIEGLKELIKMNTRRFAKRQLTWFRRDKRIHWFDLSKINEGKIIRRIVNGTSAAGYG